jgi:hypothetical protein
VWLLAITVAVLAAIASAVAIVERRRKPPQRRKKAPPKKRPRKKSAQEEERSDLGILTFSSTPRYRERHALVACSDGTVLLIGGNDKEDIVYRSDHTFSHIVERPLRAVDRGARTYRSAWSIAGELRHDYRLPFTVTVLDDNQILLIGGASVEVFDAASGTSHDVELPRYPRHDHTAVRLRDGTVMIAGGVQLLPAGPPTPLTASIELWNPRGGSPYRWAAGWTDGGDLTKRRYQHAAVVLPDDTVLVLGGYNEESGVESSVDAFDPHTRSVVAASPMIEARAELVALVLGDGTVFVAGGQGPDGPLATVEMRDLATGSFRAVAPMRHARAGATGILLPDGRIAVLGGGPPFGEMSFGELFDPKTGRWVDLLPDVASWRRAPAAVLRDGLVVMSKGNEIGWWRL